MIEAILVGPRDKGHFVELTRSLGVVDIDVRRAYLLEVDGTLSEHQISDLGEWLAEPLTETAEHLTTESLNRLATGWPFEVWLGYKRGIVDNESDSILRICSLFGVEASAAKLLTIYLSSDPKLEERIKQHVLNSNVQEMTSAYPNPTTLVPIGEYLPTTHLPLSALSEEQLTNLGRANGRNLSARQMSQIRDIERQTCMPATDVLLEALDARWSDHCYHTTWKSLGNLLSRLSTASAATQNPNIVSMFHDNAGIWDFYDGYAIALKAETHNSPSAVSAYFGQLTKLGGVLRDILGAGLGADPVGVFEYTATGLPGTPAPIAGRPAPLQIATDTIRAIKEYGNTFGTPMMWSHMTFHPLYRAKPFALGGALGLVPLAQAKKGKPQPGDLVLLIGGLTGNDGIHGASGSSAGTIMDETSVQIGSPLEEVKFRGAIIDLRDAGCIRAITDVGGAGLNSAVGEMGDPVGVWLNTALVPLKTVGLPMWRILLSESQERMVLAIIPEQMSLAREVLRRHHVRHTVVGKFTGLNRYTVVHNRDVTQSLVEELPADTLPMDGEIGMDVPYALLEYEPDVIKAEPLPASETRATVWPNFDADGLQELAPLILSDPEIADQSFADSQYDSSVQGRLTYGPYEGAQHPVRTGYWASRLLPDRNYAALFATAFSPWLFECDPVLALRQCFASLLGTMVLAGAKREDVTFCDNFYTPHLSKGWAEWLTGMVTELAALIRHFGTPVISGKDSSAGSVVTPEGVISVPPAVFLSTLAKAPDFDKLLRNEWSGPGSFLFRIGPSFTSAAGTAAARALKLDATDIDELDLDKFKLYLDTLQNLDRNWLRSGRQIGDGGLLALLVRGSIANHLAVDLEEGLTLADLCVEHRAGAVVEVSPEYVERIPPALDPVLIGRLVEGGPSLRLKGVELFGEQARNAWVSSFGATFQ